MAINKNFYVSADIKQTLSNNVFEVVSGDTGNLVKITVMDGNLPVDLSNCRIIAVYRSNSGIAMQDSATEDSGITIGGENGNEVTVELFPSSYSPGIVECELQIYSGNSFDTLITTTMYNFKCRPSLMSEDALNTTREYPLLINLINQCSEIAEAEEGRQALAEKFENMTVSATAAESDAAPTVTISELNGVKHLAFEIPAGEQGIQGEKGNKGDKGDTGAQGIQGVQGAQGPRGYTFTPSVSSDGTLSWINNGGLDNPSPVNIKGPQGTAGSAPQRGIDYWTAADKNEIVEDVLAVLPGSDGGGTSNSPAIIDVTELPTANINEDVFYRVMSAELVLRGKVTPFIVYTVDELPATGEPATTDMETVTAYFSVADNDIFAYIDSNLSAATGLTVGWYTLTMLGPAFGVEYGGILTDISQDPMDGKYRTWLKYSIYTYKDAWTAQSSIGWIGDNVGAEVFNYQDNESSGPYSHAEGGYTTASGGVSHAEGFVTTASGTGSHAEGGHTTASGQDSHAEGNYTTASGWAAHAEGDDTTASGDHSHAEGYRANALGNGSHAEGYYTAAEGGYSHAEGDHTTAASDYQHAQGKYNIADANGVYAHIVGNGTGSARSNAHTLDWDGNAWYQGRIKVGGTGWNDATDEVALKSDLANLSNAAEAVPAYVVSEANRLADVVLSHQTDNCIRFLVMSDSHHSDNAANVLNGNKHAGQAAKIIANSIGLDFAAFLGDYTSGDANTSIAAGIGDIKAINGYIADAFNGIPNFRTVGNHDGLWSSETLNGETLSNALLTGLIGSHMRHNDKGGSYGYADFERNKLRVICLNTADGAAENISDAQLKWFAETALDFTGKQDWQFMILSHHPLDWGNVYKASNILNAYITGASYSGNTVSANYSGVNGAAFIANFHGHTHCYKVDNLHSIANSAGTAYNAKRIATPNMCFNRNNEYGTNSGTEYYGIEFGEVVTYPKTADSAADTSFCVVTVDFNRGKIYADHYGAGYDRVIEYSSNTITYVNAIPTSEEYGSTAVYNGTGYKDGVYISSSTAPYDGTDNAFFATGFIPYSVPTTGLPQPIYIKGASWTADSHARFYFFDANKSIIQLFINGNGTGGNAMSNYFSIDTLDVNTNYYKLTPLPSTSGSNSMLIQTSASTQYTSYIRLSLSGSGNGVIISLGNPIE